MRCDALAAGLPESIQTVIQSNAMIAEAMQDKGTLARTLTSAEVLERLINSLTELERRTLRTLILHYGMRAKPFETAAKLLLQDGFAGAEAQLALTSLRKKGLVFSVKRMWGARLITLPSDTYTMLYTLCCPHEPQQLQEEEGNGVHRTISEISLGIRLYDFLVYLADRTVRLTKDGVLHKKDLERWNKRNFWESGYFRGIGRFGSMQQSEIGCALLLEIAEELNLVRKQDRGLVVQTQQLECWIDLPIPVMNAAMYDLWKEAYAPAREQLHPLVALMERCELNCWYSGKALIRYMKEMLPELSVDEDLFRKQWIEPLAGLGWLDIGVYHDEWMLRWRISVQAGHQSEQQWTTDRDSSAERLIVQPDLHVLVPPDVSFSVRWSLEKIAERHGIDTMMLYRLSKEKWQHTLNGDSEAQHWISYIEKHSAGIPETVRETLQQWNEQRGRITLRDVVWLHCADEQLADELVSQKIIAGNAERMNTTSWLIPAGYKESLLNKLQEYGYTVTEAGTIEAEENRKSVHAEKEKINAIRPLSARVQMDEQLPELEDIIPAYQEISRMWLSDLHIYHASTKKEIIETAIRWQAPLQLCMEGQTVRMIPVEIQENRGTWSVIGICNRKKVEWFPEKWGKMQLILPAIHDK